MVHTPTLLLVNVLVMATLAACLGLVAGRDRRDGLYLWAGSLAAHSAAYLLFSLRGVVSDWFSILLANVLLAASFALMLEGLAQFQQVRMRRWYAWAPVLLVAVIFTLFLHDVRLRILLGSLFVVLQLVQLTLQLQRHWAHTPGRGKYFLRIAFVAFALMMVVRALAVLVGELNIASITDSNSAQAVTFLLATVSMMLANFGMVVMTKEQADESNRTLAFRDELTGLHNRRYIQQTLHHHLALARRMQRPLSVLLLDIDHFKDVNDTYGHLSGDKVLHDLAVCLQDRLRAQDIAGRWGGEEFVAILPDTDAAGAKVLAEQLRVAVERTRFSTPDNLAVPLTISIGLHALDLQQENGQDDMIGVADRAMYLAKERGRNRVEQL